MDISIVNTILRLCVEQQTYLFEVSFLSNHCLDKGLCNNAKYVMASIKNFTEIFKISRDRNRIELFMPVSLFSFYFDRMFESTLVLVWDLPSPHLGWSFSDERSNLSKFTCVLWFLVHEPLPSIIELSIPTFSHWETARNPSSNFSRFGLGNFDKSISSFLPEEGKWDSPGAESSLIISIDLFRKLDWVTMYRCRLHVVVVVEEE